MAYTGFTIPNDADAAFGSQSEVFRQDLEILAGAYRGNGVISGCEVTAQVTPDMTVAVAAGVVQREGVSIAVTAGNVTVDTADGTNPRIDLVSINGSGTKGYTAGTPAAVPSPPTIPQTSNVNHIVLAMLYVPASDTAINTNQITDKRAFTSRVLIMSSSAIYIDYDSVTPGWRVFGPNSAANLSIVSASGASFGAGLLLSHVGGSGGKINKFIRSINSELHVIDSDYSAVLLGITNAGAVSLTGAAAALSIESPDNSTSMTAKILATQANITASDTFLDLRSTSGSEGSIAGTAVAGVLAYNTFTGSHYTLVEDRDGLSVNMLLEIVDGPSPRFTKRTRTRVFSRAARTIEGGSPGTPFQVEQTFEASDKPQLFPSRICRTRRSQAAVGVYLGTDKEGRDMVGSLGVGFIRVINTGPNVVAGDYLVSSDVAGCAELQGDGIYRNVTVAKATEGVVWGDGKQSRLIRCVYLGG